MKYTLRPRQEESVNKIQDFILNSKSNHGLFVFPTGYGKSLIVSALAQRFPNKYFINVTSSKELVSQNYEKYKSYGFEADICSASLGSKEVGRVTFATVGTLVKFVDFYKDKDVVIVYDECFPYSTPVITNEGLISIGQLHRKFIKGEKLPLVKTYNEKSKTFEFKEIVAAKYMGNKPTVTVSFQNNSKVETTDGHKFLTKDGWKKTKDLVTGDAVITSYKDNYKNTYNLLNEDQFDFIIGSSLGDGSLDIKHAGYNNCRISFTHGVNQENYIKWKSEILRCKDSLKRVSNNGYSKKDAFRLNSKKFFFEDKYKNYYSQIDQLNYKSLAVLWMDDGSLMNKFTGAIHSLCDNKDLVYYLKDKLISLGITNIEVQKTKSSSSGRELFYIRLRKSGLHSLYKLCAKYMHKSMDYKVLEEYKKQVGTYNWNCNFKANVQIFKDIVYNSENKKLFDLEVDGNHNYIVSTTTGNKRKIDENKEGFVVHNCHLSSSKGSQIDLFLQQLKKYRLVGLTATPFRLSNTMSGSMLKMMNRDRNCIYKSIQDVVQISEVVEQGYWAKLVYDIKEVDETDLELNTTGSEYTDESLKKFKESNSINERIIEEVNNLISEGRKSILVFVPFIQDAKEIKEKLDSCEAVYSGMKDKDRDKIINDFKNLKTRVVVQCKILSVGFDHPELDGIIMAKPSNSLTFYYQSLGRGVRKHDNKENCKIVDLSGNCAKFGKIETITIENDTITKGWAVFNGDTLLSNYPLNTTIRPTKTSLKAKEDWNKEVSKGEDADLTFYFGKFQNKKVSEVMKNDKSYLTWLIGNKEFKWYGEKGAKLKECIERHLGIYIEKPKLTESSIKDIFNAHVESIKYGADLKVLF